MWSIIKWENLVCYFCEMSDDMSSLGYYAHSSEYIFIQTENTRLSELT